MAMNPRRKEDQLLRKFGYRIHSRPCDSEPIWKNREGGVFSHTEALLRVHYQDTAKQQKESR